MDNLLLIGLGLLALGVLLVVLEAFVPSGGILGVGALAAAISGIVFLFRYDSMWGAIGTLGTVVLGPMAFFGALNMLPNTKLGRTMVGDSGEEIARRRAELARKQHAEREKLLGMEGIALTAMLPSGVVEIDGQRHDAISHAGTVEKGQPVRVTNVDGLTIEIRAIG